VLASALGALALIATMLASRSGAQQEPTGEDGACPPSVDTIEEGWICSLLILGTPTDSPSDRQITLWSEVLRHRGRVGVTDGITFSDASVEDKVTVIYETQLGRSPDPGGLAHWTGRVQASRTELAAELGIFGSREYLDRFGSAEAFVNDQYRYYLGRDAGAAEQAHWASRTDELTLTGVTIGIATSPEAGDVRTGILYDHYARRPADPSGFQHWSGRAARAGLFAAIVDFARSAEIVRTLGRLGIEQLAMECRGTAGSPDDPQPVAELFVGAWQRGDRDCAEAIATEEAVGTMFGTEPGAEPPTFVRCAPNDVPEPHVECTWTSGGATIEMDMRFNAVDGWLVFAVTLDAG
jgi:hypothetical protein